MKIAIVGAGALGGWGGCMGRFWPVRVMMSIF
jgi:hypothetical protein